MYNISMIEISDLLLEIIPLIVSIFIFIYGCMKLINKRTPNYFKYILFGIGTYILSDIYLNILNVFGRIEESAFSPYYFGLLTVFLFFMCSEQFLFPKENKETKENIGKKIISICGPILAFALIVGVCILYFKSVSLENEGWGILIYIVAYIPGVQLLYLSFKHLLSSSKNNKEISMYKKFELSLIFAFICDMLYQICMILDYVLIADIFSFLILFIYSLMMVLMIKERKNYGK